MLGFHQGPCCTQYDYLLILVQRIKVYLLVFAQHDLLISEIRALWQNNRKVFQFLNNIFQLFLFTQRAKENFVFSFNFQSAYCALFTTRCGELLSQCQLFVDSHMTVFRSIIFRCSRVFHLSTKTKTLFAHFPDSPPPAHTIISWIFPDTSADLAAICRRTKRNKLANSYFQGHTASTKNHSHIAKTNFLTIFNNLQEICALFLVSRPTAM